MTDGKHGWGKSVPYGNVWQRVVTGEGMIYLSTHFSKSDVPITDSHSICCLPLLCSVSL